MSSKEGDLLLAAGEGWEGTFITVHSFVPCPKTLPNQMDLCVVRQALTTREEAFTSYRTPHYKLHLYETLTGYRFVLLSDASTDSLRFVLRQLYTGPFIDYVVRNPLVEMDSRTTGIDNDQVGRRR